MTGVIATVGCRTAIAIVADHFEHAKAARDALKVTWRKGKADGLQLGPTRSRTTPRSTTIRRRRRSTLEQKGDVKAAFAGAAKTYKAEFRSDYGYHAQMEPLNAVVRINDAGDKVEVWEGSQAPDDLPQGGGQGARPQARAGDVQPVLHGRRLRPPLARRLRGRMRASSPRRCAARSS